MKILETRTDLSSLNTRQKEAVISECKRLLVLAGAGSGKTKTLLQKLIYLIEDKHVSPSGILAITFTKNAANEMIDRLIMAADDTRQYENMIFHKYRSQSEKDTQRHYYTKRFKWIDNLTLKTFHGFCYSILRNYGVNEFDNRFKIIGDVKTAHEDLSKNIAAETDFEVLHKILINTCHDRNYLLDFKRYLLDYAVDKIHLDHFNKQPLYREGKFFSTLRGEKVRSKSEQFIADWLFRHSIAYEYEPLVNFSDFNFRPDFYIPEANLYLEHVSSKSYNTKDKEDQFKKANKLLVKTYENMTKDSALFNRTLERIIKGRIPAHYYNEKSLSFEEEFRSYHKEVKDFVRQVLRVVDMVKVENIELHKVFTDAQKDPHERIRTFYALAAHLMASYQTYCVNKSYLDFNDLISRTIALFKNQPEILEKFRNKYQYILVDEFQDVNNLQVELIKMLLSPGNQLFCVGDDWQSIYGFRGSEVDYIINFEKHFPGSDIIKLNLNYRSTEHIVGASNEVIRKNRFQVDKEIKASKRSSKRINIYYANSEDEGVEYVVDEINRLLNQGFAHDEMLILYRRSKMFAPYFEKFKERGIMVHGKTIHASKGLESKIVFIIGLTEGYGGFPDIWLDDRIFQIIKKAKHDLLLEEERRLFYVALTRAKDELYLITERGNESCFIREVPEQYSIRQNMALKPVLAKIWLCEQCESQLEESFSYCPYCGTKTNHPASGYHNGHSPD